MIYANILVSTHFTSTRINANGSHREQLHEQHQLTQEIGNAITSMPISEPIDEDELEAELGAMEQEKLDEQMLKTGTVPQRLPAAANGERESCFPFPVWMPCGSGEHVLERNSKR